MHENEIGTVIVDYAVHLHQDLGPALLETVYEVTLARKLEQRGLPLSVRGHFEHREWLRKMHRSERTLTPAEIAERGGSGTIIVDQPGWGGKAKYCWWTPDDIDSLAPVQITPLTDRVESLKSKLDVDDLPLDRWIYDTYLSRESGTAYLVTTKRGDLVASQLLAEMVNLSLIETWSAPVGEFGAQNAG